MMPPTGKEQKTVFCDRRFKTAISLKNTDEWEFLRGSVTQI